MQKDETFQILGEDTYAPLYIRNFPNQLKRDLDIIRAVSGYSSIQEIVVEKMQEYRNNTITNILNNIKNGRNQKSDRGTRERGIEREDNGSATPRAQEEQCEAQEAQRESCETNKDNAPPLKPEGAEAGAIQPETVDILDSNSDTDRTGRVAPATENGEQ